MTDSWVSCPKMTGWVRSNEKVIIDTCPVWSWAKGKPFMVLVRWLSKFGPVEIAPLNITQGKLF